MKKTLIKLTTALLLASSVALPVGHVSAAGVKLNPIVTNKGKAIKGGQLKYALVGDPFSGVFSSLLSDNNPDANIIKFFNEGLYGYDENYLIDDSGFAKVKFDKENKQVTITIPSDAKWDDGQAITIDDVIYPYYVIGSKDYTGVRYNEDFENVVGMKEYHEGKAKEISGLKRVDDHILTISYHKFHNGMLQAGGAVSSYIEPKHVLEKEDIAKLEDSPYVRKNPVGFGPFRVKSVTPGESVTLEANEYYYKGKPKISSVVIDVVNPDAIAAEMKAGNYDIAEMPTDQYDTFKTGKNFKLAGKMAEAYTYIGFKLGKWDSKTGQVVPDPKKVLANKALRQAMAYAVDNQAVGEKFYYGLRQAANSPITPNFTAYNDKDLKPYAYNPEKAQQILAKAGFKDKDGDGFVEDPKGKSFKLKFASMSGGETADALAQYYMESWKQIGVNVELTDGRLLEMNAFYDRVQADDPNIDIFQAAIGIGGDPTPTGQFGPHSNFNHARYASKENDKLLAEITSDKSFDHAYRQQAYNNWQKFIMSELPIIPTLFRYEVYAVNNRVSQWDITTGSDLPLSEIELLADKPISK
ncbi:oligopeptide ABC transporter substrate-binding protein [Vaginisenegalia massiliensis]|uniref:oligopeptide ABC transporter substrate-binding protein n=1 Tax=Vaginisenegalia massiliensis TaxID=2058294 RepID=UPI000F52BF58|nr:oligopeptide ABC transporter substrate-binding protein [Vaginisenegalia massiliensis]